MSDVDGSHADQTQVPVGQQWPLWKVAVACIAGLALVGWATMEWQARTGYSATVNDLDKELIARRTVSSNNLQRHIHGFAFRKEALQGDSRLVTFCWPSLMQELAITLTIQGDQVVSLNDRRLQPGQTPPVPPPAVVNVTAPQPRGVVNGGMPQEYEQVVAVKLNETQATKSELDGTLARELIRQAVLIAAEDELGLPTLDTSIGESIPAGDGLGPLNIGFRATAGFSEDREQRMRTRSNLRLQITFTRNGIRGLAPQNITPIILPLRDWFDPLIEQLEAQSRGAYAGGLQAFGFKKSSDRSTKPHESIAPENHLDLISQFAVIRHVRAQIRATGETPELLGELVQAYANLGNIVDFHWSLTSKACKARSLLYAQRLIAKTGSSPFTLAHMAYAQSLAGQHWKAIKTVEVARSATGKPAPEWLDLVDAHCNFKLAVLDNAQGSHQELAYYLRSRMVEPMDDPEGTANVIARLLKISPACFRATETLTETSSFGIRRAATASLTNGTWDAAYRRLEQVPNLPSQIKEVAAQGSANTTHDDFESEIAARLDVIQALEKAENIKNCPGPSCQMLAQMLRDASVVQIYRRLQFDTISLATEGDDVLRAYRPLIDGHRHEKYLDSFCSDQKRAIESLKKYFDTVDPDALDFMMVRIFDSASKFGQTEHFRLMGIIRSKADDIYEDYLRKQNLMYFASDHDLIEVSPKWSLSIAEAADFKRDQPLKEWEEQYASSPAVLYGIHRKYLQLRQTPEAIRCLEKLLGVVPSSKNFQLLAALYKAEHNLEKWHSSLMRALESPDYGLDHARVGMELAEYYGHRGEWEKAKPHAVAAAESGSEWGLMVAARVFEGLEQWDEAEAYVRAASQRYLSSSPLWYFWCVRTGRGELDEARLLAMQYWKSSEFAARPNDMWQLAIGKVIDGDMAHGHSAFLMLQSRQRDLAAVLFAAVLADEAQQEDVRDDLLRKVPAMDVDDQIAFEMADLFLGMLNETKPRRWNSHRFEHAVIYAHTKAVPYLYLMAARFLTLHNEQELSVQYLHCVATIANVQHPAAALAADMLRKQGLKVGAPRKFDLPDTLLPVMFPLQQFASARDEGRLDDADQHVTRAISIRPDLPALLIIRGELRSSHGRYLEGRADYEKAIQLDSDSIQAHEKLAWMLATADEAEFRDGELALKHAQTAADLRQFATVMSVATLAAAHAERGDFEKAVALEKHARTLSGFKKVGLDRLKEYEGQKGLRITPKPQKKIE